MLLDQIKIFNQYTRAANIERDSDAAQYIITDNALRRLSEISNNMLMPEAPRAWNLIGPYGAGKSAFALYLSALLDTRGQSAKKRALNVCDARSPEVADRFRALEENYKSKKGFCPLLITGAPEPMAPRIISKMRESLADFGIKDNALTMPRRTATTAEAFSSITGMLRCAANAVASHGGAGLLIIIDEMGKFLEYDAYHPDSDNAYLLQALGEWAFKPEKDTGNILLFSIMHKNPDDYLRSPDSVANWRKVEGRFEQLAFIENPEHMLRLVSRMFKCRVDLQQHQRTMQAISNSAHVLWDSGIFTDQTLSRSAENILVQCYPLHPLSAVLLAALSEKIGQNERTMFAYIGGAQMHGFSDIASRLAVGEFIMPWNLYDYFLSGGLPLSADSALRKMWAAVENAMQRLGENAPQPLLQMLKTIALFNLCGVRGQFAATPSLLSSVFDDKKEIDRTLKSLKEQSYITYRKFSDDYRIWEGSDFDLDGAVAEEVKHDVGFSAAKALNNSDIVPPIVAHKHAIVTGNLRRLQPFFIDASTWREEAQRQKEKNIAPPRLLVYLATAGEKIGEKTTAEMCKNFSQNDCLAISRGGSKLESVLREGRALRAILHKRKELLGDAVAAREVKTRMAQVSRMEHLFVRALFVGGDCSIYWRGKEYPIANRRGLQNIVSAVMDDVYDKAPHVFNELINRDKPSAQANGARNKLLAAAKEYANKKNLGIEKYPPEKGMYLSLLHKTGMHRTVKGRWKLCAPTEDQDTFNFLPVWQRLQKFMNDSGKTAQAFPDLDLELQAPPFGVKGGMLPLFYALFILSDEHISFFEDGKFAPHFTLPHLERFLAQPHTFTFRHIKLVGKEPPMFAALDKIFDSGRKRKPGDILAVARPLIKFINDLPPYAQNTQRINESARAVCRAVLSAKSPHDMFLQDIPRALGFSTEDVINTKGDKKNDAIKKVIHELRGAYPALLSHFGRLLADSCGLDYSDNLPMTDIQEKMTARIMGLDKYCMESDELLGFFRCLRENIAPNGSEEGAAGLTWLKRLLLMLSDKNSEKWEDDDFARAERKLAEHMRRITDLEKLRGWEIKECAGSSMLVRIISARGEHECMVNSDGEPTKVRQARKTIQSTLNNFSSEQRRALLVNMLQSEMTDDAEDSTKEKENETRKLSIA